MIPLWLIPLFPLVGTLILAIVSLASSPSKKGPDEGLVSFVAVLFPVLAFLMVLLLSFGMPDTGYRETLCNWFDIQVFRADFGFLFDGLSRTMLLFVTGIGSLITLYSTGYMHGDRGFARFFAYINLFLFSMIVLVLSDSLPLTFLGWEGVGLCSYLLIGFWNSDLKNCKAANKAFIVNRVGDLGFLLGMLALVSVGGVSLLSYPELAAWLVNPAMGEQLMAGMPLLTLAGLLFFFGCTGKSAQIPLLTWLPDAMAGPTPVSALIHAATMVTSGVYLLARLSSLYAILPEVLMIVTFVGLATAFWAAVTGLFQNDIKKVLAYSTISQLGYMFMAAGVAAFDVSIFHVFTHAFFKASLFLGAGAVIHALSGEQDMRRMGGLWKKTPLTALVMIFGWLAIIGFPGFAGFWSKDMILEKLYVSDPVSGPILYGLALLTAVITAVYMTRLMILTFFGTYRGDAGTECHIHEAPASMLIPMLVLSVGSAFAGFLWAGLIPGADIFREWLAPVLGTAQIMAQRNIHESAHISPWIFAGLGTAAALIGILIAWKLYSGRVPAAKGDATPKDRAAEWTFFFDKLHKVCGIAPTYFVAWIADAVVNRFVMLLQWFVGALSIILSDGIRVFQVRKIRLQMGLSLLGMALVLVVVALYGGSL
jgi:NADH-quinone oxidoreductase subunit L